MSAPLLHEQEARPAAPPLPFGNVMQRGELPESAPTDLLPDPAGASRVQLVEIFGGNFYRTTCELCGCSLGLTATTGGTGLCGSCRATLRVLRRSRVMAAGRRVARLLGLSAPLAGELVAYRAGEAALQGRLPPDLAAAAGIPALSRFTCPTCGMGHTTRTAAIECCAADANHPSMEAHAMNDHKSDDTSPADKARLEEAAAWDEEFAAGAAMVGEFLGNDEDDEDDDDGEGDQDGDEDLDDFDAELAAGAALVDRFTAGRPRADEDEGDLP